MTGIKCLNRAKPVIPRIPVYFLLFPVISNDFLHNTSRPSRPEACGLRHLAFSVDDVDAAVAHLEAHGVPCEGVRIDPFTGKRFTFFNDPDGLPLEIYQQ